MAFQEDSIYWVEVEKIVPNPFQPRREFDESKLKELAESVRMYGILQPLTVTRKEIQGEDGSFRSEYELIAGERRLRASKLAGLQVVPVIIRDGEQTEQEKLELAIIENLQREDLNAVDRALAFRQLADVFGLTFTQVAKKVGRSREYVSNTVRLLGLPDYMLDSLRVGDISEGHGRTLLMLNDRPEEQDTVYREILLKKLSVREVERIARNIATDKVRKKELVDNDLIEIERQFTETLGTRVSIVKTDYGGRLTIDYFSMEDLEAMLARMKDEAAAADRETELPEEGSLRAHMELIEDRETRDALETLTESTGLEVADDSAAVTDIHEVVASTEEVDDVIAVVDPVLSEPEAITTASELDVPPAPVSVQSQSALRAQLASLLGTKFGQGDVQSEPAVVEAIVTPTSSVEAEVVVESVPPRETPAEDDDSDLYSMSKFTV